MFTLASISQSQATCGADDAQDIYKEIHARVVAEEGSEWLYYNSRCHSHVELIATTFMNRHATAMDSEFIASIPEPSAIFRFESTEGVLYANGAVALTYDDEDGLIELWVEKDTVRLFNYPTPDKVEIDGSSSV